jgi:hypothetical protein
MFICAKNGGMLSQSLIYKLDNTKVRARRKGWIGRREGEGRWISTYVGLPGALCLISTFYGYYY